MSNIPDITPNTTLGEIMSMLMRNESPLIMSTIGVQVKRRDTGEESEQQFVFVLANGPVSGAAVMEAMEAVAVVLEESGGLVREKVEQIHEVDNGPPRTWADL